MTKAIQNRLAESKTARWTVLALVSFLMLCAYYVNYVISPLKTLLGDEYQWTSSGFGFYVGAVTWLNVFALMLIFSGVILDKKGVRFTGILSAVVMAVGTFVQYWAMSSPELIDTKMTVFGFDITKQILYAGIGFAIFGSGMEMAGITVSKIIVKWFKGKEMALAMGLEMACARIGTALALFVAVPIAIKNSISTPMLLGLLLLILGTLVYLVFVVMDAKRDKQEAEIAEENDEPFVFSDIVSIFKLKAFWYIAILCMLFYSTIFPFLNYATDLMVQKFGVGKELAGTIPGLLPFGTILLTPIFGNMYDRKGKGASIMIFGSAMIIIIHTLFALPAVTWWVFAVILTILLGVAFSLVPSAMWPSVPKIIPMNKLGTAYALIFWVQNWGLLAVPMLIGKVLDNNITSAEGVKPITYDYSPAMAIFAGLGVLALIFAFLLKREDKVKGYGLEQPNIQK